MSERYLLEDEGVEVTHGERPYHKVVPMIAMNDPEPQPRPRYFGSLVVAEETAIRFTASEPWRTHAQVWSYTPGFTVEMRWFERERGEETVTLTEFHRAHRKS